MVSSIAFVSGKGGTGKSTMAAGISYALCGMGMRVIMMDMDVELGNLDILLGMYDVGAFDLNDILRGRQVIDCICGHPQVRGLGLIKSPRSKDFSISREKMVEIVAKVRTYCDVCVIDAPAGLSNGFEKALWGCQKAVVVTTPDAACVRDAADAAAEVDSRKIPGVLLINRVRPELIREGIMLNIDDCMDHVGLPLCGVVSEDGALSAYPDICRAMTEIKKSNAVREINNIAARLCGKHVPLREV